MLKLVLTTHLGNNIVQKSFRVTQYFKSLILRNNDYASTLLTLQVAAHLQDYRDTNGNI